LGKGKIMGRIRKVTCEKCGAEFVTANVTKRFCSSNCQISRWSATARRNNPAHYHARDKRMRERNAKKIRASLRDWWIRNREKVSKARKRYYKEWATANPEINRNKRSRRRARERNTLTLITLTVQEWILLVSAYHSCCAYCGVQVDKPTIDHILPLSKGGSHTLDNVLPSCLPCNKSKASRDVGEFLIELEALKM